MNRTAAAFIRAVQHPTTSATRSAGGVLRLRPTRTWPSMITMLDAGDVALAHAVEQVLAGGVLGAVHDDEVGGAAGLDDPAVELALPRRVAGGEAERQLRPAPRRARSAWRSCGGCRAAARPSRPASPSPVSRGRAGSARAPCAARRARPPRCRCGRSRSSARTARRARGSGRAGSAVWPPLMWPMTSASASSTTSLSIRPEPGIEGPPVWMVLWMPYLRAQPTIALASSPLLTPPRPTSPSSFTPACGQLLEVALDHALLDHRRAGQHLDAAGPEGVEGALRRDGQRLHADDVLGTPGQMHLAGRDHGGDAAVAGSCRSSSICCWRGVQSPNTGWTWLSIRPGATVVPLALTTVLAPPTSRSFSLADRQDAAALARRSRRHRGSAGADRPTAAGRYP